MFTDDINVSIDGPARTEVKRENAGDRATFTYLPMTPGSYSINLSYKGKAIKGSPFQAKVSGKFVTRQTAIAFVLHYPTQKCLKHTHTGYSAIVFLRVF